MAIVLTQYENVSNTSTGNIQFDVSKFDYSYDGDTFPTDAASDFDNMLKEIANAFTVTRQTDTTDGMGNVTAVSDSTFSIYAYITDITKKDRQIHDMGLAVPGNRALYLKPTYPITSGGVSTDYVVKEGDIFLDRNSYKWKVIKIIHEPYIEQTQIYSKCVVQSIGMEGSP